MRKLLYKDYKIYENDRLIYKLKKSGKTYEVLYPSGKILSRFKIRKVFGLKDIREAIIGNIIIRKEKKKPIEDVKILNRNFLKLYPSSDGLYLLKDQNLLATYYMNKEIIEVLSEEGLSITIFFALKMLV